MTYTTKRAEIIGMTDTQIGMARLDNWARWGRRGEMAEICSHFFPRKAAICGEYLPESGDIWDGAEAEFTVDEKDAVLVERLVLVMPVQLRNAVTHWYFGRPRTIGISCYTLQEWMCQAARRLA